MLAVAPGIWSKRGGGHALFFTLLFSALPGSFGGLLIYEAFALRRAPIDPGPSWGSELRAFVAAARSAFAHPFRFGERLFDSIVREEPQAMPRARHAFHAFVGVGLVLFLLKRIFLEGLHDDALIRQVFLVWLCLAGPFLGLVYWKRKNLAMDGKDWLCAAIVTIILGLPWLGYLPFLNAVGSPGEPVAYSGIIVGKWNCESSSGHSGDAGRDAVRGLFDLTAPFCVEVADSSGRKIVFEVGRRDYLHAEPGARFERTLRRGRLGLPYRWWRPS